MPRPVICRRKVLRGHGQAYCTAEALAQRTRGDLDALILDFRVPWAEGTNLC